MTVLGASSVILPADANLDAAYQNLALLTAPAPAAGFNYKATGENYEVVSSLFIQFVTDATAGNRQVEFRVLAVDGADAFVVTTTERTFVVRVQDGKAEWVNVKRGPSVGDLVEVYGTLKAGDTILRRGSDEIRPGTPITAAAPKG